MEYEDLEQSRLTHLELIQTTIARLAGNSFLVKGWAITLAGAFFGFALSSHSTGLAIAAAIPVGAFWALDAYFLHAERLFRALYDEVRSRDERVTPFAMGATEKNFVKRVRNRETACDNRTAASRVRAFFSLTLVALYVGLLLAAGVIAYTTYCQNHPHHQEQDRQTAAQADRMRSAIPSRSASSS
jgi:hypothetical protein